MTLTHEEKGSKKCAAGQRKEWPLHFGLGLNTYVLIYPKFLSTLYCTIYKCSGEWTEVFFKNRFKKSLCCPGTKHCVQQ